MTFDAGTWWLLTVIVTTVVGLVGFLFGRSVFRQLDENRADIKEVRENYTPRTDHQKDLEAVRREMKEMRTEMRTEIRQMSDDVKDIKHARRKSTPLACRDTEHCLISAVCR